MTNYGVDTSVLVRLVTGEPEKDFKATVTYLEKLHVEKPTALVFASNQVIGESYIVLQQFYGLTKKESRSAIASALHSGYLKPQNGREVIALLEEYSGPGTIDRLIAQESKTNGQILLTRDRKLAKLDKVQLIR